MKHSFVSYRSNGQFCRAVLEVALLLAISICLLQQIKTLSMKHKSHYQSSYSPSDESKIISFGRKGTLEYTVGVKTNFQGGNDVEEYKTAEDRGVGDDELDRNEEHISMVLKPEEEEEEEEEETQVGDEEDMELMKTNYVLESTPMAEKEESDVPSWFINDIVIGSDNPEDVDRSFPFEDENGIPPDGIELLMSH